MTLALTPATSQTGANPQSAANWGDAFAWAGQPPEFCREQPFALDWQQPLFDEVGQALALGQTIRPAIIGPLTYLWLGKVKEEGFDKLELLEPLLPLYGEVLGRLAAEGLEWVQIDEPILALELAQEWKNAFERAYHILQYSPLQKLLAVTGGGLTDNLGVTVTLPVAGLHIDLVSAPQTLPAVLDRLPTYKVLSFAGPCELALLQRAQERFGDNLWLASDKA
jgi:5-methyltetrahydropteroyltriglutamate--homocysteine methyltransferase